jgi:3-phenylpropionate/trans-cinnamate dioxygenase ferredoxin component
MALPLLADRRAKRRDVQGGTTMTTFIDVGSVDQLDSRGVVVVAIPHSKVVLFNVDGRICAMDDACLRCGRSLAEGRFAGRRVTCPCCNWQYDLVTGCINSMDGLRTAIYEVKIDTSRVLLEVPLEVTPRDEETGTAD